VIFDVDGTLVNSNDRHARSPAFAGGVACLALSLRDPVRRS